MFRGPATGLYSSPNPFSQTPDGTLKVANNVRFTAAGVLEPRRGFDYLLGAEFGNSSSLADSLAFYAGNILLAYDLTKVSLYTVGEFVDFAGTFEPVGANGLLSLRVGVEDMRFEGAARSIFFNTSNGLMAWDGGATPLETEAATLLRALDYSAGGGDLGGSATIDGDTSGAEGTIVGSSYDNTAGTVFFSSPVSGGPFQAENLSGDGGWTGVSSGADVQALSVPSPAIEFTVGRTVTGLTSGATAKIVSRHDDASNLAFLELGFVVGTFQAENVVVAEAGLSPRLAGNPQGLNIVAAATYDDGWQDPDTAVAYRFTICSKDRFGRIIEGPPNGRTVIGNNITTGIGLMSLTSNVVSGQPVAPDGQLLPEVGEVITLLAPGETSFPIGAKTITFSATGTFAYSETAPDAIAMLNHVFVRGNATANTLTCFLPVDADGDPVTGANFIRVYRSFMTFHATDNPSDELFQVYESPFLTDTDIANGFITFTDTAPEDVLDVPLYTNTNTDGPLSARYQPPLALDMAYWANRMWLANTTAKHSAPLELIGVGSPDGIQSGDTLSFVVDGGAPETFTASDTLPLNPGEFFTFTDGDPGFNIQRTALGLCVAINDDSTAIYARYVSSEGGLPGDILLTARAFGDTNQFNLYSSRATAWSPQLPDIDAPAWTISSDDNRHPAGLVWSPLGIPDAVPPSNNLLVNSDNDDILRIFPLHYRLLIFKTDGIYTCTNVEPFAITKLSAYRLLAPDSLAVLEDRVYALTDQGIITISDAGVVDVSTPINDVFNALDAPGAIVDMAARSFGLSYRAEHEYALWCIESEDDGTFSSDNAQAFALSTLSDGFVRYPFGIRCGAIDPDANAMVVAPTDNNKLWLENKSLTDADYYDLSSSLGTPSAVSGAELTFAAGVVATVEAGDVVGHSGAYYLVTDASGTAVTTSGATGWTTSTTVTLYKAFVCEVEFNKLTAGTPAELKMMQQASFLFRENGIHETTATFSTEITTLPEEVALDALGWGEFAWGAIPWGCPTQQIHRVEPLPDPVAQCAQLSVGFRTRQARAKFEFLGIDVLSKKDASVNRG